ncbi:MAG: hypothetical protein V1804_01090 [Patescibacteria group bacterium]
MNAILKKKQLGQFFTKNAEYILKNLGKYIKGKNAVDPFAGNGDLIEWAKENDAKTIKGFDIDSRYIDNKKVFKNDSIKNVKKYNFVITNPPYLNVNKANKEIKKEYFGSNDFEDLYHISLNSIMNSEEGIAIVPINFLSAQNSKKIRNIFFSKFRIVEMNYFKHQVFPDTTYNVIAFYYRKKDNAFDNGFTIKTHIYPEGKKIDIELCKNHDWSIGGKIFKLIKNQKNFLGVKRLTEKDIASKKGNIKIKAAYNHVKCKKEFAVSKDIYDAIKSNIILLKAIDSGSEKGKIALENIREYGVDCLVSKETSRHMIYLVLENKISISDQKNIINSFNKEINKLREDYLSLFLTNYRDKDRKRISFDFVYKFINYLYFNSLNYAKRQSVLL